METLAEREARIAAIEARRAEKAIGVWPTPDDAGFGVTQVAPGRGNLNYTSYGAIENAPTALRLIDRTPVSFARLFQSQPRIGAAVMRMLTWATRVPLRVYQGNVADPNDSKLLGPGDHPLAAALQMPWDRGSALDFVCGLLGPVLVNGNAVTTFSEGASGAIQFQHKDWRWTQPIMPWRDEIVGFNFDIDNPVVTSTESIDQCLHVKWWSAAGPIGTSPLQMLGTTLNIEDAAQRFQMASFRNGARPSSAITASDAFLGLERAERAQILANLREDITTIYSGPDKAGIPAVLPPGLTWAAVGQTTNEAMLIEQRTVTANEIAAVYQIFPMMLGDMDNANYSNLQAAAQMTYTDALGPALNLIECSINSQFVWPVLRQPDIFVKFDFDAVLRGDRPTLIDALAKGIGSGMYTPNDAVMELGKPKSDQDGMDKYYMPLVNNLAEVGADVVPAKLMPGDPEGPGLPVNPPYQVPGQQPPTPPTPPNRQALHYVQNGREYAVR